MNLFDYAAGARYPASPGFKDRDTSRAAADSMEPCAKMLRLACERALVRGPKTADEVAALLDASVLSIRPRITELFQLGKIVDTGERRKNASGRAAKVWRLK